MNFTALTATVQPNLDVKVHLGFLGKQLKT